MAYLVVLLCSALLFYVVRLRCQYPKDLPRIGRAPGQTGFSLRTWLRYYTDCRSLFRETYRDYSSKGKTVLIPGLGFRSEIIMPTKSMPWVLALSDKQASLSEAFLEMDQVFYSLGAEKYVGEPWQGHLVKTDLNKVIENICAALNDELGVAFDRFWGTDAENWKRIDLLDTVRLIVAQAANRFTIGGSSEGVVIGRDLDYIRTCIDLHESFIMTAGLAGASPRWARPFVGRLSAWSTPKKINTIKRLVRPLYQTRLKSQMAEEAGAGAGDVLDHFQMMVDYASLHQKDELLDLDVFVRRLIASNFGAMHQTGIQVTNLLLNILSSDTEYGTMKALREEFAAALDKSGPNKNMRDGASQLRWSKAELASMKIADSVARETLRLHSFGNRAVMRKVMVDDLVTEDGVRLPRGALISFLGHPAQTDKDVFGPDADKFDPFRFSRRTDRYQDPDAVPSYAPATKASFVSTSAHFLPFGHGKHACPGRFLVDFELKMIMAYALKHYEIRFPAEYNGKRPETAWVTEAQLPPKEAQIEVLRRKSPYTSV